MRDLIRGQQRIKRFLVSTPVWCALLSIRYYLQWYRRNLTHKNYRDFLAEHGTQKACIVSSTGGSATTFLITYLAHFIPVNDQNDRDGLKHAPFPPPHNVYRGSQASIKFIFLYRDIEDICASLHRRNLLCLQSAKLGSLAGVLLPWPINAFFFKCAVARQIRTWMSRADALCIHYDALWDSIDTIYAHLELSDPEFIRNFPKRIEKNGGGQGEKTS